MREPTCLAKSYDPVLGRVRYFAPEAGSAYWDAHWEQRFTDEELERRLARAWRRGSWVVGLTRRRLGPAPAVILEGGCGSGMHVAALSGAGYRCVGLDSAARTIERIRRLRPELDVRVGELERLDFDDDSFDAYWSVGVIEHPEEGYSRLAAEMFRVLKPGGYLFLAFPHMSGLRRAKGRLRAYAAEQPLDERLDFFQYALDEAEVRRHFEELGFEVVGGGPRSALFGLRDDIGIVDRVLAWLERPGATAGVRRAVVAAASVAAEPLAALCGHQMVLVLRKP